MPRANHMPHRKAGVLKPEFNRLRAVSQTDFQVDSGPYDDYHRRVREVLGEELTEALYDVERPTAMVELLLAAHVVPYDLNHGKETEVRLSPEAILFHKARTLGLVEIEPAESTRRHISDVPLEVEDDRPVCHVGWQ